jgi:hypothetical protein
MQPLHCAHHHVSPLNTQTAFFKLFVVQQRVGIDCPLLLLAVIAVCFCSRPCRLCQD